VALNNQDRSYKDVLGLQRDPFAPEPDPAFYYSFDSFEQRLKVLQGLVQGADILVLVIGEPGSGKTTLLNRYLASTNAQVKAVRILTDPDTASTRTTDTLDREGYPAYVLQDSENPIVIVDDAHKLPQKELEFLLQEALVPGGANNIKRLILFGEPDLYTRVTDLAETFAAQPAVNKIYLPGLTEKQTGAYLQHRLAAAGYTGKNPFNTSEIKDIHHTSGGYPGSVNEIANQWLKVKYSTNKEIQGMLQHLSAPPRHVAVWIAAGIIIILLAALWYFPGREPAKPKPSDQKITKQVIRKKIPREGQSAKTVIRKKIAAAETTTQSPPAIKTPPAAPETSTQPIAERKPKQPAVEETELPEAPVAAQEEKAPPPKIEIQPKPSPKTEIQPEPPPKTEIQPEPPPKTEIQPEPPPATPRRLSTAGTKAGQGTVQRERWLLSRDPASYTIQILGVHNEQFMLDFIRKNKLLQQNEIAYYESTFQGKPWYQLLYGIYPTRQAAEEAADNLAENIRRAGPWIRRMSTIQKTIRDRGLQ
jgi:DamX protein